MIKVVHAASLITPDMITELDEIKGHHTAQWLFDVTDQIDDIEERFDQLYEDMPRRAFYTMMPEVTNLAEAMRVVHEDRYC